MARAIKVENLNGKITILRELILHVKKDTSNGREVITTTVEKPKDARGSWLGRRF